MGWSFPLLAVRGTVVRVHVTFLLLLLWIGAAAYARGGPAAAGPSVLYILLLFLCVLLHEFGHVFAARRYGVRTPDITLLPIGGVARLERIPEQPGQELVIALAGPAVNVVIAAGLFLVAGAPDPAAAADIADPGAGLLQRLLATNLLLAAFNLIPAFPMDGGRVLRALLAYRLGYGRGTEIAARVGQGFAFLLGLFGLLGGNVLLVFVALFVYLGAASEAHAVQARQVSRGVLAADAMVSRFESLRPDSRVEEAVGKLLATTQPDFPVVDGAGVLRGVLTRDDMIRALRQRGPETPLLEVMRADIPVVRDRQPLSEATRLLQESRLPAVGVADASGRLVGLITPENVGEMLMVLAAQPRRGGTATPRAG